MKIEKFIPFEYDTKKYHKYLSQKVNMMNGKRKLINIIFLMI